MDKNRKTLLLTLALVFFGILLLAAVFASQKDNKYPSQTNLKTNKYEVVQTYQPYSSSNVNHIVSNQNYNSNTDYVVNPQIKRIQTIPVQTYYLDKNENRACLDYGEHCYYQIYPTNYDRTPANTYEKDPASNIHYTQYSTEYTQKGFLGDYVKEYSAYVTNTGRTGRYFTVDFNLEDKNGYEFTQSVTLYLRSGEQKKFVYRDTQYEINEILHWDYNIIPEKY